MIANAHFYHLNERHSWDAVAPSQGGKFLAKCWSQIIEKELHDAIEQQKLRRAIAHGMAAPREN